MTLPRLSRATLARARETVRRPGFDVSGIATGIVHIGIGAFARAHLAWYTQPLLAADPSWGILGVSLRSAATRDALAPQDWLYTCAERDGFGERLAVIGALTGLLVGPENSAAVVKRLADPSVRIVTISVSEKGYHRRAAHGTLDEDDSLIQRDLANSETPRTLPGLITAGIRVRREVGIAPFTVLCCDNLPENGNSTQRIVVRFAELLDPALGRFIAEEVAFPNSMVDRIVPATTDEDRVRISKHSSLADAWPVVCEPFSQWVIEDRFPLGRPAWERTGAQLVDDVHPYETMKLRILNGAHSCIAYLGQLAGWQTVAEAMSEPSLALFINALMREAATTLNTPASFDLAAYREALLVRFANPALHHRTAQIAMDGSQKMPMRLLATAQARLARGMRSPCVALGVAAWLHYLRGCSDDGSLLVVDDPMKDTLLPAARAAEDARSLCAAIFAIENVVPPALASSTQFRAEVLAALEQLETDGVRETLIKTNQGEKRHEEQNEGAAGHFSVAGSDAASVGAGAAEDGREPQDRRDPQGGYAARGRTGERAMAGREHHRRR